MYTPDHNQARLWGRRYATPPGFHVDGLLVVLIKGVVYPLSLSPIGGWGGYPAKSAGEAGHARVGGVNT